MTIRDIWRAKSDEEIAAAYSQVNQYRDDAQAVIRSEYDRRFGQPDDTPAPAATSVTARASEEQGSLRRASLEAARAHLASLRLPERAGTNDATGAHTSSRELVEPQVGYEYLVVPFMGQGRGGFSADDVARQLQSLINQHAARGWHFCQVNDINIEVQPGCIAGLFGASVHYVRFDQVIFRRAKR